MPFVEELIGYGSVSVVGIEKNTGKTECLNHILRRVVERKGLKVAVTSAGVDGESVDRLTGSHKPEITIDRGVIFSTDEKFYRERCLVSEVIDVDERETILGRLITARALSRGRVLVSGPPSITLLKKWIDRLQREVGVDLCLIDGALSRLSLASPEVSEAMVLNTGAAFSLDYAKLVGHTAYVVELINLPEVDLATRSSLGMVVEPGERGMWLITGKQQEALKMDESSAFAATIPDLEGGVDSDGQMSLYVSGALTDRFLGRIAARSGVAKRLEIIVGDFTKVFARSETFRRFVEVGGRVSVLRRSSLIAICVNPVSPNGVTLDSRRLCHEIETRTGVRTYDIFKDGCGKI